MRRLRRIAFARIKKREQPMLTYLILTTRATLMTAMIIGAVFGYAELSESRLNKRLIWASALIGLIVASVIAYFRNATNLIDTAVLNGYLYLIYLICFVIFLISSLGILKRTGNIIIRTVSWAALGVMLITSEAYAMPEVIAYPYHVWVSEES